MREKSWGERVWIGGVSGKRDERRKRKKERRKEKKKKKKKIIIIRGRFSTVRSGSWGKKMEEGKWDKRVGEKKFG